MSKWLARIMVASACLALTPTTTVAQLPNGATAGKPVIGLSYYKVPPGQHDQWLALFKKWHYPLIQEMIREGVISDFKLLIPNVHGKGAGWDFIGVTTGATSRPKVQVSYPERIRKVFPDLSEFEKGEKERWALTVDHWDELTSEIDITSDPLSLYLPVGK